MRRLTRRLDYLACYDRGQKYHTGHFLFFVLPRPEPGPWRLGTAVSRKMGGATRRNRIKRVLREFFRLHQDELRGPLDIVAVPKRHLDARQLDLGLAQKEIRPLLGRISRAAGNGFGTAPGDAPPGAGSEKALE